MPLTKNTTRALAASIAFVAAGATLAGAAVFHLPVLGFGPPSAASAAIAPVRSGHPVTRKVTPIKVVRTRYVDDIVHRPAPASAYPTANAVAATYSPPPAAPPTPVVAVAFTPTAPTTTVNAPQAPARYSHDEGSEPDREAGDHAPPGVHDSTSTTANASGADQ